MLHESDQERLKSELATLRQLLDDVDQELDDSTKEAMRRVSVDLQKILAGDTGREEGIGIGRRLRDAMLDFEAHHPRLAQVVDQITSVLANAGI